MMVRSRQGCGVSIVPAAVHEVAFRTAESRIGTGDRSTPAVRTGPAPTSRVLEEESAPIADPTPGDASATCRYSATSRQGSARSQRCRCEEEVMLEENRSRRELFGCPHCGSEIHLAEIKGKEAVREFGCGQRVPLIATCILCVTSWSKDQWQEAKSRVK